MQIVLPGILYPCTYLLSDKSYPLFLTLSSLHNVVFSRHRQHHYRSLVLTFLTYRKCLVYILIPTNSNPLLFLTIYLIVIVFVTLIHIILIIILCLRNLTLLRCIHFEFLSHTFNTMPIQHHRLEILVTITIF